jgi:hypothetical protein
MYPLQITLTPDKHSDSHKTFLSDYESWTERLEEFDVLLMFLWVSPKVADSKLYKPTDEDNWPAHYEEYVPISQVHLDLWAYYMHVKRRQTKGAFEPPTCRDRQGRVEKQGLSEETERPGEQVASDGPGTVAGPSERRVRGSRESVSEGSRSRGRRDIGSGGRRNVYQSRTVAELKLELKSHTLRQTGKKKDLVNRLVEDDRTIKAI